MSRNHLADETSPYLLQHADNPVHWFGWGPEAMAAAERAGRPILLSVGYAACHWCHVMAHECFENDDIAALMNAHFVSIKVDREERPDIDTIYQHALQLLGQQGGWPLTMFLAPDGRPFWGGTYFPPESRWGRPGFPEVLTAISEHWTHHRDKALKTADALSDGLQQVWTPARVAGQAETGAIALATNDQAASAIARNFDKVHGGFGKAPKFPNPPIHELLWRTGLRNSDQALCDLVELSLTKMCQGGIYDHLGGGFARYSTDDIWLVPHFEKMLYDNAQLVDLLTWAWQKTGNPLFAERVAETLDWVIREMTGEKDGNGDCAFAATYDADSEGQEGKFYTWSAAEVSAILGEEAPLFAEIYGVTETGNWEDTNILNRIAHPELLDADQEASLAGCRERLLRVRSRRVWPGWDDKVLADWNGLMISALAHAGRVFERNDWLDAAATAFRFVRNSMTENGRLLHSWRNGRLKHMASLDDYANMARAALSLYETTGQPAYLEAALDWVHIVDDHHWDNSDKGYFFTADDAETLIVRTRTAADNATPAGNATLVQVLSRLFYLTGQESFRTRAEAIVATFAGDVARAGYGYSGLLCGNEFLQNCVQVVILGDPDSEEARALIREAWRAPNMNKMIVPIEPGHSLPPGHPAAGKTRVDGKAAAYVCVGQTCSLPVTETAALRELL